jgi:hypothetical protein
MMFALLCLVGCGSKGSVSLTASIQKPRVAVEQLTLGTRLTGGFNLVLEVGEEASSGSTVSLERFELVRDGASVAGLTVRSDSHTFPLRVEKGQLVSVPFVFDDSALLAATVRDAICAGPVQIAGAVTDTLSGGRTTPVTSAALTPSGC